MVTIKIKNGTPEGLESLCVTCRWGHIVKGFRASEEIVRCRWLSYDPSIAGSGEPVQLLRRSSLAEQV